MYNAANYVRRFVSVWVKCLANVVLFGGKNSSQLSRERYAKRGQLPSNEAYGTCRI